MKRKPAKLPILALTNAERGIPKPGLKVEIVHCVQVMLGIKDPEVELRFKRAMDRATRKQHKKSGRAKGKKRGH